MHELEPPPLEEEEIYVPRNLQESRRYAGRIVVAGAGNRTSGLMFVSSSVLAEEATEEDHGTHRSFKRKPAYLKGPAGIALKDVCTSVGIMVDRDVYYTALAKWLLPQGVRLNPKLNACEPGFSCLEREMEEVKPKVVVAFGKAAFEFLTGERLKFDDAVGQWFWSERFQCRVMPMSHQAYVLSKPEWKERYRMDLQQVKLLYDETQGMETVRVPLHYEVIHNAEELKALAAKLMRYSVYSIDCEWHGSNHVDGQLRSLQICWAPGEAAYIRFMNDKLQYAFDVSYKEAGAILSPAWDRDEVELVGHHIAADLPWTTVRLGLKWWKKTRLDTEFAYQTCDEHGELGLERMSLRYTDLGRYESELDVWKRNNKSLVEHGYGFIPDEIMIPYACRDVDVPFRAYRLIEEDLARQGMLEYYQRTLNPFVTDIFTQFALTGLPMNVPEMERMREVYTFAYDFQHAKFREAIVIESAKLLARNFKLLTLPWDEFMEQEQRVQLAGLASKPLSTLLQGVKTVQEAQIILAQHGATQEILDKLKPSLDLFELAPSFNIQSSDNKKLWLFGACGYMPVKSTANKNKGVPAMAWEKVMALKPERREGISPAADKQSLQIIADKYQDPLLKSLLALTAIATVRKNLLREPERDPETGMILEEEGMLAWVCSDGRIHGQLSMTETGRPRAWKPNILNWSSFVQDKIKDAIMESIMTAYNAGTLPAHLLAYATGKPVLAIRSTVQAPEGWMFTESDYVTAEVFGLAYISGDENLIRIMTEPDAQFGVLNDKEGTSIRLNYAHDCHIPPEEQDPACIMALWDKMERKEAVTLEQLRRDAKGDLLHPRVDLHWSLAEMFKKKPREKMNKKTDRGAGKTGNFRTAYGAAPTSIERAIEADVGKKPEPGTGQSILDALDVRQPVAQEFLKSLESLPKDPGYMRAASGKLRHFVRIDEAYRADYRMQEGVLNSQGREARNFLMQESVATTAARAAVWLLDFAMTTGLQGRPFVCLYDSIVTLHPTYERMIWQKAHLLFMSLTNGWLYHGRVLRYQVETEFNPGWSLRPPKTQQMLWDSPHYMATPEHLKPVEDWLDRAIAHYRECEAESLTFSGWRTPRAI